MFKIFFHLVVNHVETEHTYCVEVLLPSRSAVADKVARRHPGEDLAHGVGREELALLGG